MVWARAFVRKLSEGRLAASDRSFGRWVLTATLVLLMGAGCSMDELEVRPESPKDVPAFAYDLYCDGQGRFTYDGAALKLVMRPAHLERVYADSRRGQTQAKELVRELEEWFARAGAEVADVTTRPACLPLPELTPACQPNWQFLTKLIGHTPEADRLRDVVARAYEVRAHERGLQNRVIVEGVNLLIAGGMARGLMTRTPAMEARTAPAEARTVERGELTAGGGIQANKAAGDAWSQAVGAELKATHEVAVPEVTVKTQSGVRTRLDWVTKDAAGNIGCVECKASATAPLTPNQAVAFPEIGNTGATVVGKGKPGVPGGTVIPPTSVEIKRP